MKEAYLKIEHNCRRALTKQHGKGGVPEYVMQRLNQELSYLERSEALEDFSLFAEISAAARRGAYPFVINGTVVGSYIVYLLGNGMPNPLPAHYHCPECGVFELPDGVLVGADLPNHCCPNCGQLLNKDGFSLPIESVWGTDGNTTPVFEYRIPDEFYPALQVMFQRHYEGRVVLPCGVRNESPFQGYDKPLWKPVQRIGLVVLPEGKTAADYGDHQNFLENGEDCLCGAPWELREMGLKPVLLFQQELLNHLVTLQRATGVYATDLQLPDMQGLGWADVCATTAISPGEIGIIKLLKPQSWSALMNAVSAGHTTYARDTDDEQEEKRTLAVMLQKECFQKYPVFTREDFFDHLCAAEVERTRAFEISEFIRKGRASSPRPEHQEKLKEYALPPDLETLAKHFGYIFPRAYAAVYMLNYLRLAKYAQLDRQAFCRLVFA